MKEQDNQEIFSNQNNKHSKVQYKFSVPNNWEIDPIEKLGKVQGGGTPSTSAPEYWNGDIPWLTPTEVTENREIEISETERNITEKGYDSSSTKLLPENSILLTTRATIGNAQINKTPMCTNQGFQNIIPEKNVNTLFLYYQIKQSSDYLNSLGSGSTFNEISKSTLKNIKLPKPKSISEQRKIASVLYNVDQAIQKTEEIIEQTQRVKKGLMQDLFTEGYFEHDEFEKKEPLNKRPIEWDTKSLNEIAEIEMGNSPKSKYYNHNGEGLPFYQGNNEFGERYPNTKVWCSQPVKTANKNDILISVRAPVGDLNITTEKCCIGRGLASITTKNIDKNYLFYHLKERKKYLIRISAGSTYDSINSSQLKNLNLKIPPLKEQQKVAEILMKLDNKINSNRKQKHQLQRIKKGLMQDLLTGKVRTKDKDIEILKEVLEVEEQDN